MHQRPVRELKALLQRVEVHRKNIFSVLASITGKSTQEIERIITEEATLSAEEAQKVGLVHEIMELRVRKGADIVVISPVVSAKGVEDEEAGGD